MNRKKLRYRQIDAISRSEFSKIEGVGDQRAIEIGLVAYVLSENELEPAFDAVLGYLSHENSALRGTAILCVGHIARMHRAIPDPFALNIVRTALTDADEYVRGQAHSAWEDIETFVPGLAGKIG